MKSRYYFDKAVGKVWSLLGAELAPPGCEPALDDPLNLREISIEWPVHYGWAPGFNWVDPIRSGLSRYVAVRQVDIPQLPNAAIQIQVLHEGVRHKVIIDYFDKHEDIFDDYLKDCLRYFKMQFRAGGYEDPRIVPGLYVPSGGLDMYRYLPRLRRIRDDSAQIKFDVYGRFGLYPGSDVRARALSVLQAAHHGLRYEGGGKLLALTRSLSEVARSKICVDLPGRGPFCHRLVDYLSIGSCIVAYPHRASLYPPLVPGRHIVYCRPDFSDLVEVCHYYLTHEQERQAMIDASREYFDTHLHKDSIASYYLEQIATQLGLPLKDRSSGQL